MTTVQHPINATDQPDGDHAVDKHNGTKRRSIYLVGGVSALIVVVLALSEVVALMAFPQPRTVMDWFTLYQSNPFIGIVDFWGLEVPMYVMFALVFLALFKALRPVDEDRMAIALMLALMGITVFLATTNPISMLSLSNQYAASTDETERITLLAAGQTLMTNTNQRALGGFNVGLLLVSVAGVLVALVMFQSQTFGRFIAYAGLLAHGLSLADYLRQLVTQSEIIALLIILPNALFIMIWFGLVGRKLYKMGHVQEQALVKPT